MKGTELLCQLQIDSQRNTQHMAQNGYPLGRGEMSHFRRFLQSALHITYFQIFLNKKKYNFNEDVYQNRVHLENQQDGKYTKRHLSERGRECENV